MPAIDVWIPPDHTEILTAAYRVISDTTGSDPTVSIKDVLTALGFYNPWQDQRLGHRVREVLIHAGFTPAGYRSKRMRYRPPEKT